MSATIWSPNSEFLAESNATGTIKEEKQVAIAAQVNFILTTFAFVANTGSLLVFKNGLALIRGEDYTEVSNTGILLTSPATVGDELLFVGFVGMTGTTVIDSVLRADILASTGSSIMGYILGGAGSVYRSVQSKMSDFVSVKDKGATGLGVVSDSAAIQLALDTGRDVYIPDGDYILTTPLTLNTVRQNIYFAGNAILKIAFLGAAALIINAEWVTLHVPNIQNAPGYNTTSANGVATFVQVNKWYFTALWGVIGGTGVGKYARSFVFADGSAGPPIVGSYVSTLEGVRMDGADATSGHTGVYYGAQANTQRLINCHITNYAAAVKIDGSWPTFHCHGNCFEGNTKVFDFHSTGRHQDGLLASTISNCYCENNEVTFYIANGDIHNLSISNIYCSGRGTATSHFLQVSDTAALGALNCISFDQCWVQNVNTVFKMGASLIAKTNWKITRIKLGTAVTNYATGNYSEQAMMYNDPPVFSTLEVYGGAYPLTLNITGTDNNNHFSNAGGGGELRFQLPTFGNLYYTRAYLGMRIKFTRVMGFSVKIYPAPGQNIVGGGLSKYIELTSNGTLTLICTGFNWALDGAASSTLFYEP